MADSVGALLDFLISRYRRAEQQHDELRLRSLELVIASCAVEVRGRPAATDEPTLREPPVLTEDVFPSLFEPPDAPKSKPIPDSQPPPDEGFGGPRSEAEPRREARQPPDELEPASGFPTGPLPDVEPDPVEALWLRPLSEREEATEQKDEIEDVVEEDEVVHEPRGEEPPPQPTPPPAPPPPESPPPTPDPAPEGPVRGAWEPPER